MPQLTPDLAESLLVHDWPLNVRGLLTVLSVAVVSAMGDEPLSLGPEVRSTLATTRTLKLGARGRDPVVLAKAGLTELMERFHGKVAAAARHLGVTRPRLYRMPWGHGIKPARFRNAWP